MSEIELVISESEKSLSMVNFSTLSEMSKSNLYIVSN